MKQWLKDVVKNFVAPGILFAALVLGWWAYNDIEVKKAQIAALETSVQQLSQTLGGQCQQLLETQGFVVEKAPVE